MSNDFAQHHEVFSRYANERQALPINCYGITRVFLPYITIREIRKQGSMKPVATVQAKVPRTPRCPVARFPGIPGLPGVPFTGSLKPSRQLRLARNSQMHHLQS